MGGTQPPVCQCPRYYHALPPRFPPCTTIEHPTLRFVSSALPPGHPPTLLGSNVEFSNLLSLLYLHHRRDFLVISPAFFSLRLRSSTLYAGEQGPGWEEGDVSFPYRDTFDVPRSEGEGREGGHARSVSPGGTDIKEKKQNG